MLQQVTIEWSEFDVMPARAGEYLVAFSDGTVETYPISDADIQRKAVRDGYTRGILWAQPIPAPDAS